MKTIKEKPAPTSTVKEKIASVPKELSRQGRNLAIANLRKELRTSAQQGEEQDSQVEVVADDATDRIIQQGVQVLHRGFQQRRPKEKSSCQDVRSAQTADTPPSQTIDINNPSPSSDTPSILQEEAIKPKVPEVETSATSGTFSVYEPDFYQSQIHEQRLQYSPEVVATPSIDIPKTQSDAPAPTTRPVGQVSPSCDRTPKTRSANATHSKVTTVGQRGAGAENTASQVAKRTATGGRQLAQSKQSVKSVTKGIQQVATAIKETAIAVAKTTKDTVTALIAGGSVTLIILLLLCVVGIILVSPLGLFFAEPNRQENAVSPSVAIGAVTMELSDELERLQTGYDTVYFSGSLPPWSEVLAVFSAYATTGEETMTVASMGQEQIALLSTVFWDMIALETESETISHEATESEEAWTESILTITITPRIPADLSAYYAFESYQIEVLDEMLAYDDLLTETAQSLSIGTTEAQEILANLPDDLDPDRQAVIEQALSLVGKVTYFWGGKSLTLGWNDTWGQVRRVWAAGNSTSEMYLPYGLDCSGFVDWVFYNVSDGAYILGQGGGVSTQHTYCTAITWEEALPGDLVFYADDSHIGIYAGEDETGEPIIIHCSMGYNNVVITGQEGFTLVGRPDTYG